MLVRLPSTSGLFRHHHYESKTTVAPHPPAYQLSLASSGIYMYFTQRVVHPRLPCNHPAVSQLSWGSVSFDSLC